MGKSKKIIKITAVVILILLLLISIGLNVYLGFFTNVSYLQSTDEIYIMEAGMLRNTMEYAEGESFKI